MQVQKNRGGRTWDGKVWTIPNLLSFFRLALIPLIAWLYLHARTAAAFGVLLLSGATDVLDGFIARRWRLVSDLGKALDPVADKLTQLLVLGCLARDFVSVRPLLLILLVKELALGALGLFTIRRTGVVTGAFWHGKLTTCVVYAVICAHILFPDLGLPLSRALTLACAAAAVLSLALYARAYARLLRAAAEEKRCRS